MRVLMVNTPQSPQPRGGDTVQIEKTAEALRQQGVEPKVSTAAEPDAHGFDIAHVFNLRTIDATERQVAALAQYGVPLGRARPEIFNTDQGAQFTASSFTGRLEAAGVAIGMDGRGRALDNVFVERLWRSVKYEEAYLKDYADGWHAEDSLRSFFRFYCDERLHQSLAYRTPAAAYQKKGFKRPRARDENNSNRAQKKQPQTEPRSELRYSDRARPFRGSCGSLV
jgi:hypothetical protein